MSGCEPSPPQKITLHATTVEFEGQGVLIVGASGSGKSSLALNLMAFGALLVADDRTQIELTGGAYLASAPETIKGLIEARGVGLLKAQAIPSTELRLAIDMDTRETERVPPVRSFTVDFLTVNCLHKVDGAHFPFAILQYLRNGRQDPV